MFIILSLIVLVAAFNIISSLIMLVRAKTRDMAILRTMGAPRDSVMRIFIAIGLSIGVAGTVFGMAIGFGLLFFRQNVLRGVEIITGQSLWDPSIRFLTELPSKPDPVEIVVICAMVACAVATYVRAGNGRLLVGALMPPAGLKWRWGERGIGRVGQQALTAAEWREQGVPFWCLIDMQADGIAWLPTISQPGQ